jgi:hypothetical protein
MTADELCREIADVVNRSIDSQTLIGDAIASDGILWVDLKDGTRFRLTVEGVR